MLSYLHVKNIALIDELEIDFNEGLNVLTGETGAGKSIIIGSIDSVLGQKIPKDFVRKDAEFALVELIFQVSSPKIIEQLREMDIEIEEELLISRKISSNGRSVFKINGEAVNLNDLKTITSLLIDLHSQHEHQSLLEKKNHVYLLDRYLGDLVSQELSKLKTFIKRYQSLKNEAKDFTLDENLRSREIAFLEYEINEIEQAQLVVSEDLVLEATFKKQSNMHTIQKVLSEIYQIAEESSYSLSNQLSVALDKLNSIKLMDEAIDGLSEQLIQIDDLTRDFSRDLFHYADDLVVDAQLLEDIRIRIDLINTLKTKHGRTIEEILEVLDEKNKKLNQLNHFEERLKEIQQELRSIELDINNLCLEISKQRIKGAKELSQKIVIALHDLNLKNTSFEIKISEKSQFNQEGKDEVEFLISTNMGEDLKPLIQIASGGELSRVMLGIKSVLADCDEIDTLIFDEIDTGISGRTAQMVAEKMLYLSKIRQIICITHLPQIASMADHHYLIEKKVVDSHTITSMEKLTDQQIPNELARLIGGAKITEAVIASAQEMKNLANDLKRN